MVNEIVVTCPVCALEVGAALAGTGLVVACHQVPGTRFPCPEGGTMVTSGTVENWRGRRSPGSAVPPPVGPLMTPRDAERATRASGQLRGSRAFIACRRHGDDLVTCRAWKPS
jgi:hypothetical protein